MVTFCRLVCHNGMDIRKPVNQMYLKMQQTNNKSERNGERKYSTKTSYKTQEKLLSHEKGSSLCLFN